MAKKEEPKTKDKDTKEQNIEQPKQELDVKLYIESLVKAGYDEATATERVNKVVAAVRALMPKEDIETIKGIVDMKVSEMKRVSKDLTKIDATVVGVGERRDANEPDKRKALEAYKKNPTIAVQDGLIRIEKDTPIPLDTKRFFDDEQKMKNNNFGKPIGIRMQRDSVVIAANKEGQNILFMTYGDVEMHPAAEYSIFGKYSKKGNSISIPKTPGVIKQKNVDPVDMWNRTLEAALNSDMAVELVKIPEQEKNAKVVIKAKLQHVAPTSNGSVMFVFVDDDYPEGLVGFANSEYIVADVDKYSPGNEVIAIGTKGERESDGVKQISLSILGIVKNPNSDKSASVMKQLDKLVYT